MAREIPLGNGRVALVDDADYERVAAHRWHAARSSQKRENFYAKCRIGRRTTYMHRFILAAPPGAEVDHRNRDGLDNRRENLRTATRSQNGANKTDPVGRSGFRGVVCIDPARRKPWRGSLVANGRRLTTAYFETARDAAVARDALARLHHGEFAILNFP